MSRETLRVAGEKPSSQSWGTTPGLEPVPGPGGTGTRACRAQSPPQGLRKHLLYVPAEQRGPTETTPCPPGAGGLRGQREDGSRATLLLVRGLIPALPPVL